MKEKHIEFMEINRIDKRTIEALAVLPIIELISDKFGRREALAILKEVNQKEAFQRGQKKAVEGQNTIDQLVKDVDTWGQGGAWDMKILEKTSTTFFFNVFRCPYYERYAELGLKEFGVELSCCRDEPFARGFDPNLKLVRTQTIMEGADHCDFRYYLNTKHSAETEG